VAAALLGGGAGVLALQPRFVVRALAAVFGDVVWRVPTGQAIAALTFDDGPDPVYTPQVLDILRRRGARATFFLIGGSARAHPGLVRRIRAEGHEVANHTFSDATTWTMDAAEFERSLLAAEAVLGPGAARPKLMRPAGGLIRPAQLERLRRHGYVCVLGSAYAFDPYRPPAGYIRWAIGKNLEPGAIAVLHDAGGDRSRSVAALEGIIDIAEAKGLRLVAVSELLAARER
jgi:peptidoglycan/xylan/chitin deacetylase (PgdA/CDA1 family)